MVHNLKAIRVADLYTNGGLNTDHLATRHLNNRQVKVCNSDIYIIQMFVIQMPNELVENKPGPEQTMLQKGSNLSSNNWAAKNLR